MFGARDALRGVAGRRLELRCDDSDGSGGSGGGGSSGGGPRPIDGRLEQSDHVDVLLLTQQSEGLREI